MAKTDTFAAAGIPHKIIGTAFIIGEKSNGINIMNIIVGATTNFIKEYKIKR